MGLGWPPPTGLLAMKISQVTCVFLPKGTMGRRPHLNIPFVLQAHVFALVPMGTENNSSVAVHHKATFPVVTTGRKFINFLSPLSYRSPVPLSSKRQLCLSPTDLGDSEERTKPGQTDPHAFSCIPQATEKKNVHFDNFSSSWLVSRLCGASKPLQTKRHTKANRS